MGEALSLPPDLYEWARQGAKTSAEVIAPIVKGLVQPKTVVDIGCGEGWWGRAFEDLGCTVVGFDIAEPPIRAIPIKYLDISRGFKLQQSYDLAICLEVAEHLPFESGPLLVDSLVGAAPVVLWSAAYPGQGGWGHINEQSADYWQGLFREHGYEQWPLTVPMTAGVDSWYARACLYL